MGKKNTKINEMINNKYNMRYFSTTASFYVRTPDGTDSHTVLNLEDSAPQGEMPNGPNSNTMPEGETPNGSYFNTRPEGEIPHGSGSRNTLSGEINGPNFNTRPEGETPYGSSSNTRPEEEMPNESDPDNIPNGEIPNRSDSAYSSDSDRLVRDYSPERIQQSDIYSRLTGRRVSPSEVESTSSDGYHLSGFHTPSEYYEQDGWGQTLEGGDLSNRSRSASPSPSEQPLSESSQLDPSNPTVPHQSEDEAESKLNSSQSESSESESKDELAPQQFDNHAAENKGVKRGRSDSDSDVDYDNKRPKIEDNNSKCDKTAYNNDNSKPDYDGDYDWDFLFEDSYIDIILDFILKLFS